MPPAVYRAIIKLTIRMIREWKRNKEYREEERMRKKEREYWENYMYMYNKMNNLV